MYLLSKLKLPIALTLSLAVAAAGYLTLAHYFPSVYIVTSPSAKKAAEVTDELRRSALERIVKHKYGFNTGNLILWYNNEASQKIKELETLVAESSSVLPVLHDSGWIVFNRDHDPKIDQTTEQGLIHSLGVVFYQLGNVKKNTKEGEASIDKLKETLSELVYRGIETYGMASLMTAHVFYMPVGKNERGENVYAMFTFSQPEELDRLGIRYGFLDKAGSQIFAAKKEGNKWVRAYRGDEIFPVELNSKDSAK